MESKDLVVDQVLVEYQAYCAGQLSERLGTTEAPDGAVEYCGDEDDPAHWAICYVRASDGVVRPLVVGQRERVLDEFRAMDRRSMPFWDALLFPPPVAVIGGHEYPFKAAGGRHLLGVVRLDRRAVLLAAADDRLVAVLLVDGVATTFPLGRPQALREVDVAQLDLAAGHDPEVVGLRSQRRSKRLVGRLHGRCGGWPREGAQQVAPLTPWRRELAAARRTPLP